MDLLVYVLWRDISRGLSPKIEKSDLRRDSWKIGNELTGGELFTDELSTAQKGPLKTFSQLRDQGYLAQRS
jgi:hypothetical protein